MDEVRFWVSPTTWGEGERPLGGNPPVPMHLIGATTFDTGIVLLCYRPA